MGNDTKIKANTIAVVDNNKAKELNQVLGNLSTLNTTNKDSLVGAINELLPVILYENETGTSNNFTLNDSVTNYEYIEVYTRQENYTNGYKYEKIYEPNGKKVFINYARYEGSESSNLKLQSFGMGVTFSGTNATVSDKFGFVTGNTIYSTTADSIKVVKVIGYK